VERSLFHQLIYQLFNLTMTANGIIGDRTLFAHKLAQAFQLLNHQTNSRHSESPKSSKAKQPNQSKEKGEISLKPSEWFRVSGRCYDFNIVAVIHELLKLCACQNHLNTIHFSHDIVAFAQDLAHLFSLSILLKHEPLKGQ